MLSDKKFEDCEGDFGVYQFIASAEFSLFGFRISIWFLLAFDWQIWNIFDAFVLRKGLKVTDKTR